MKERIYSQENQLAAALRGGLRGEIAESFGILQSSVEALQRCLQFPQAPGMQEQAQRILQGMQASLAKAEQLADGSAELILLENSLPEDELYPVNLTEVLETLRRLAVSEAALRGRELTFAPCGTGEKTPFWVQGEPRLVNGLLVQLVSGALCAACGEQPVICGLELCRETGVLSFWTNAGSLSAERDTSEGEKSLRQLLVRRYARAMGWRAALVECSAQDEKRTVLELTMRPAVQELSEVLIESPEVSRRRNEELLGAVLRRELDAEIGPASE